MPETQEWLLKIVPAVGTYCSGPHKEMAFKRATLQQSYALGVLLRQHFSKRFRGRFCDEFWSPCTNIASTKGLRTSNCAPNACVYVELMARNGSYPRFRPHRFVHLQVRQPGLLPNHSALQDTVASALQNLSI